jgi:hypothetical protein
VNGNRLMKPKLPSVKGRWTRTRFNATGQDNIYRFRGWTLAQGLCRRPVEVEAFVRDPEARAILGRWTHCPNVNVAHRIAHIH